MQIDPRTKEELIAHIARLEERDSANHVWWITVSIVYFLFLFMVPVSLYCAPTDPEVFRRMAEVEFILLAFSTLGYIRLARSSSPFRRHRAVATPARPRPDHALSLEELETRLAQAVEEEDYAAAARLRDTLERLPRHE